MKTLAPEVQAALEAGRLVSAQLVWFTVRVRADGSLHSEGYWDDVGTVDFQIIGARTGIVQTRTYVGSGTLIEIDPIPRTANLQIQRPQMRLSGVVDRVQDIFREFEARQARVETHRALFNPETRAQVAPAEPEFAGFVDQIDVTTPAENDEGGVVVDLVSHLQEITRTSAATRSGADQESRSAGDSFYDDTTVAGRIDLAWGQESQT